VNHALRRRLEPQQPQLADAVAAPPRGEAAFVEHAHVDRRDRPRGPVLPLPHGLCLGDPAEVQLMSSVGRGCDMERNLRAPRPFVIPADVGPFATRATSWRLASLRGFHLDVSAFGAEAKPSTDMTSLGRRVTDRHATRKRPQMTLLRRLLCLVAGLVMASATPVRAQDCAGALAVCAEAAAGSLALIESGKPATVLTDADADPAIGHAAQSFAADSARVGGVEAPLVHDPAVAQGPVVLIGELGRSALIEDLRRRGLLDADDLAGQWEAFRQIVVDNPFRRSRAHLW
jgi:hypothetical protein